jgi:hypothetical protein
MINEHDIKDFPNSPYADPVPLYKLSNGSYFTFPGSYKVYYYEKPDGMYSICYDEFKTLYHFAVFSEVIEYIPSGFS